jgi:hypothetical protein
MRARAQTRRAMLLGTAGFLVAGGRSSPIAAARQVTGLHATLAATPGGAVLLGRGFDSVNGSMVAPALNADAAPPTQTGFHTKAELVRIETQEELYQQTDFSVDASASYGAFGSNASFTSNDFLHFSSYQNYLLVKVHVQQEPITLANYHLTDDALRFANQGTPRNFFDTFGDSFISDVTLVV